MTDPQQLQLVHPDHGQPIDPRDQATRIPGVDAECPRKTVPCRWPFCTCYRDEDAA
jgi:hypothetical protein